MVRCIVSLLLGSSLFPRPAQAECLALQLVGPSTSVLAGPVPLVFRATNTTAAPRALPDPAHTWETQLEFTDATGTVAVPLGTIRATHAAGRTRTIVEDAAVLTLAPGATHEFVIDAGARWPERFRPGTTVLRLKDLHSDPPTLSPPISIRVTFTDASFPHLLALAGADSVVDSGVDSGVDGVVDGGVEQVAFAVASIRRFLPTFENTPAGRAHAAAWWATNKDKAAVRALVREINASPPSSTPTPAPAPAAVAIGRFRLAPPAGFVVAAREQWIYGTAVWTVDTIDPDARVLPPEPGDPSAGVLPRHPALGPSVKAVWVERGGVRLLEVALPQADHVLRVRRDAPVGKEATAEKLVGNLLSSYRPAVAVGFAVGHGSIHLGPSQVETTRLHFRSPNHPDEKIRFSTRTVARPDTSQGLDTADERALMQQMGGRLEIFVERRRTLAGCDGVEIQLLLDPPDTPPLVRFTWHFAGVAGDATRPSIHLVASTTPERRATLAPIWDALLASLTTIPVAAPR